MMGIFGKFMPRMHKVGGCQQPFTLLKRQKFLEQEIGPAKDTNKKYAGTRSQHAFFAYQEDQRSFAGLDAYGSVS
jgi:hypothetical protein